MHEKYKDKPKWHGPHGTLVMIQFERHIQLYALALWDLASSRRPVSLLAWKNLYVGDPRTIYVSTGLLYIWDLTFSCDRQAPSINLFFSIFSLYASTYANLHKNMWEDPTSHNHVVLRPKSSTSSVWKAGGIYHHEAHHLMNSYPPKSRPKWSQTYIHDVCRSDTCGSITYLKNTSMKGTMLHGWLSGWGYHLGSSSWWARRIWRLAEACTWARCLILHLWATKHKYMPQHGFT